MTDNPLVASGTQSPVEHLRALAIDAFPERSALKSTPIGKSLVKGWSQLSDSSGLSPWELASGIGRILKIPVAENLEAADLNSARLIPEQLARSALVLPLNETGGELHVACAYPFIGGGVRRVRFASDRTGNRTRHHSALLQSSRTSKPCCRFIAVFQRALKIIRGRRGRGKCGGSPCTRPDPQGG